MFTLRRALPPRACFSIARALTSHSPHLRSTPIASTLFPILAYPKRYNTSMSRQSIKQTPTIAILGAGDVGATIAYSLIQNPSAGELLLVDPKIEVRDAQIQDLADATSFGNTTVRIRAGTHAEAGQCSIVVIAAGAAQKKGESRTDLIGKNKKILESAIADMKPFRKDTVVLVVANPVDVLTLYAQRCAGLPAAQVLGSGTFLDSVRLRGELSKLIGVAASSIDAFVLGEHGESQVVAWSRAGVGGLPLSTFSSSATSTSTFPTSDQQDEIETAVRTKAASLIEAKGSTNFGIGAVTASLCKSILADERVVRAVSCWQEDMSVCLSMPVVVGRGGVVGTGKVQLSEEEQKKLAASGDALREVLDV